MLTVCVAVDQEEPGVKSDMGSLGCGPDVCYTTTLTQDSSLTIICMIFLKVPCKTNHVNHEFVNVIKQSHEAHRVSLNTQRITTKKIFRYDKWDVNKTFATTTTPSMG